MLISAHQVLTNEGWKKDCTVVVENGQITKIRPGLTGKMHYDILTNGLFDIHVHGGCGYNTENSDMVALRRFLLWEAENGVTDVLLTVSTTSIELYHQCIPFIRNAMELQQRGYLPGATIRGIHLEGPFLSFERLGAMIKAQIQEATIENLLDIVSGSLDGIKLVTIAPEVMGAEKVIRYLVSQGICVQAGHSNATYEEAEKGFGWGIDSICHTFNACRPIHHRDPGIVTAALLNPDVYCETICDLNHLHPATIRLIRRCKGFDRMCIISDSICTTGLPDGVYVTKLGKEIHVRDGCMRVSDGALDGGVCTIGEAMSKLARCGLPLEDIIKSASYIPAQRLHLLTSGVLAPGNQAHISAWDCELKHQKTWIGDIAYG